MRLAFIRVLAAALWITMIAGAALAQETLWQVVDTDDFLYAEVCPQGSTRGALPEMCFGVICGGAGGSWFDYVVNEWAGGTGGARRATLSVDGRPVAVLDFAAPDAGYDFFHIAPHDPARHAAVPQALVTGRRMGLAFDGPPDHFSYLQDLTLDGAATALTMFGNRCLELRANGAGRALPDATGTPFAADPASRFVPLETAAPPSPATEALVRTMLSARIALAAAAAPPGTTVALRGHLLRFADGRGALIAILCPGYNRRPGECETHPFVTRGASDVFVPLTTAAPGAGPFWLDTGKLTVGLPELVSNDGKGGTYSLPLGLLQ
jgi:hypothetical protein